MKGHHDKLSFRNIKLHLSGVLATRRLLETKETYTNDNNLNLKFLNLLLLTFYDLLKFETIEEKNMCK